MTINVDAYNANHKNFPTIADPTRRSHAVSAAAQDAISQIGKERKGNECFVWCICCPCMLIMQLIKCCLNAPLSNSHPRNND